mmetsp:Transcript_28633/g.77131  ORF Transcript_28633/g.77131 Transcript_28633/m.77131 type:complete len:431 (+) Transcript_28633:38-1330(+)
MGDDSAPEAQGAGWMRSADVFERLEKVGEGMYGEVYLARSKDDGAIVALKKIRMTKDQENDGFPITALREIRILKQLKHKNVIDLKEIVTHEASEANRGKSSIYMVFEFMDHDLTGLMKSHHARFTIKQIKCYMQQLLEGMNYCHQEGVLHRDIKSANLLVNSRGELKIGDFGLARKFDRTKDQALTNRCITLWYRPPELLLGATRYGPEVDVWSIGCVFGEILLRGPLLNGRDEADQFDRICKLCGTPDAENWPACVKLPDYDRMVTHARRPALPRRIKDELGRRIPDKLAIDLLDKMLALDPVKRISAMEALDHDYFWTEPFPAKPEELPTYGVRRDLLQKKPAQTVPLRRPPQQVAGAPSGPAFPGAAVGGRGFGGAGFAAAAGRGSGAGLGLKRDLDGQPAHTSGHPAPPRSGTGAGPGANDATYR